MTDTNTITMTDCLKNAQKWEQRMTSAYNRDNLIIDLFVQSQSIEDAITALELLGIDEELAEACIIPLPVQVVIVNLKQSLDDLQNVLTEELERRSQSVDLDAPVPALGIPLNFNES